MNYSTSSVDCDVLVVGGGGAALIAALEARKTGSDVILVSKGTVGRGGNTIVSGAGFAAFLPGTGSGDSPEQFRADILSSGKGINSEKLVDVLVENSGASILDLETYGIKFLKKEGEFVRRTPPGHSRPRQIPTAFDLKNYNTRGLSITLPLREAAIRAGIKFMEKTPVVKLQHDGDGVCGAVGIDLVKSKIIRISAKAVVLATGGAGRVYERSNNTVDVTGDGYALALDAGARLLDMEFVQYYPTKALKPVTIPVSTPLFGDGAVLRNKNHQRFLSKYDPAGDMATRDSMSRAIFSEVSAGNGIEGGVYMDCGGIPSSILDSKHRGFAEYLRAHGLDPHRDLLIVSPTTHFFMGGIAVDSSCRTDVSGLFAAGEVVGGLHGANRLSGNALTEAAVFGKIAGQMAAAHAKETRTARLTAGWGDLTPGRRACDLKEIKIILRRTMWQNVSLVRSHDTLRSALFHIQACKEETGDLAPRNCEQLAEWVGLKMLVAVAEAVTFSALMRTETRGSHYRDDFQASDDANWVGNVEVRRKGESLCTVFNPKNPGSAKLGRVQIRPGCSVGEHGVGTITEAPSNG